MNRRRPAVLATACALITLSSCATFNRNDAAVKVGDASLSAKAAEKLAATGDSPATADAIRGALTKWIRVTVLEGSIGTAPAAITTPAELDTRLVQAIAVLGSSKARSTYELGASGSPLLCLGAITVANIDDANSVLATINSGTSFSDAAHQFSTDTVIKDAGGVVKDTNGKECLASQSISAPVVSALKDTPVGQPVAADLGTFSAVLMLRPFADLLPESQALIASASVPQEQLDAIVDGANIYVDPRYGRWDRDSGSVVTLTS